MNWLTAKLFFSEETYKLLLEKHQTDVNDKTTDVNDKTNEENKEANIILETSFQQVERIKKYKGEAEDLLLKGAIPKPVRKSRKRFSKPKIRLENGQNHANFTYPTIKSSISKYPINMKGLPMKNIYLLLALLFVMMAPFISDSIYELVYNIFK